MTLELQNKEARKSVLQCSVQSLRMDLNIKGWVVEKDRDLVVFLKSEECINSPHQFGGKAFPMGLALICCLYCVAPFAMKNPDKNNLTSWSPR